LGLLGVQLAPHLKRGIHAHAHHNGRANAPERQSDQNGHNCAPQRRVAGQGA